MDLFQVHYNIRARGQGEIELVGYTRKTYRSFQFSQVA